MISTGSFRGMGQTYLFLVYVFSAFLITRSDALAFPGPPATPALFLASNRQPHRAEFVHRLDRPGSSITPAPRLLSPRDTSDETPGNFLGYVAADNICGYSAGDTSLVTDDNRTTAAMRCEKDRKCAVSIFPFTSRRPMPLCCLSGSCISFTTCINQKESSTRCSTNGCGDGTLVCSSTNSFSHCGYDLFDGPWGRASWAACFDKSNGNSTYVTTYSGQPIIIPWAALTDQSTLTATDVVASASVAWGPSASEPSHAPIGAIVGAAVGGFIALVIGIGLLYFIYRKRRNKSRVLPELPVPGQVPELAAMSANSAFSPNSSQPPAPADYFGHPPSNEPKAELGENEAQRAELGENETRRAELP